MFALIVFTSDHQYKGVAFLNNTDSTQQPLQPEPSQNLFPSYLDWSSGVDLDAPHEPLPSSHIAYISEAHEEASNIAKLTPCAELLYRHFLQSAQAGIEIETSVKEIQEWTDKIGRNYTIQHIRRSLKQLTDAQLISIIKRYLDKRFFQVIVHLETLS